MTDYVRAHDETYDAERSGYNRSVEHRPAVVVPARSTDDVLAAVRHARERGLGVAVLATGHGPSRSADGQVLVNTSRLDDVEIDPVTRTARVGAGVRGGTLVAAAAQHGLAPVNGSSPEVGVVAYHLGGGLGVLGRRFGWAVDHVRAIELVTAGGELRRVTAEGEPELFWGLRGGGRGTLGVVTALEIDLHPVDRIYGGGMHFAADRARDALLAWADWSRDLPEAMGTSVLLVHLPDLPFLPEELRGHYVVHVRFAWAGPIEEGERLVQVFRDLGPVTDSVVEMPYADVGTIHAEPTAPVAFHARNAVLGSFGAEAVDVLLSHAGPDAGAGYLVEVRLLGGALGRPGAVPSALGRRDGQVVLYAGGAAEAEQATELLMALDRLLADMSPWGTGGVCVNFLSGPDVTAAELASGYLPGDIERLDALKATLDPDDLFRTHHGRA